MSQQIRCPHCSNPFITPPGSGGLVVACPHCGGKLRVPGSAAHAAVPQAALPPSRSGVGMPPPRPSVPPHRAMPPAPASPQVTGAGIPFAPVIQDPSLSSTSSRLMRRRKQASTNIVWYIAIPVTGLLLLGLAGLLVLLITKKDKHTGAKESVTAEVAGQSRLVGTWQLDLDAMVREEGVTGREAEMALAQLQSMGLEFEFDFRNDGSLEFHAKLPDEGLQRESGKWSVKNTRGDGMEIAFDVDGQFLDETLIIRFLDNDHWRADFGGETIVLRRVQ